MYDNGGRKRGLQVGYVRSLETILGVMIRDVPEVEEALRSLLRAPAVGGTFFDTEFVDDVTNIWHSSLLHEDIKLLLKSHEDSAMADIGCLPTIAAQSPPQQQATSPVTTKSTPVNATSNTSDQSRKILVELRNDAEELVDEYFRFIHPWFPIVERRDVLYMLHSSHAHEGLTIRDKGRQACLLSIIALMLSENEVSSKEDVSCERIRQLAIASATVDRDGFDIGHIQAHLLLVLVELGRGQLNTAWTNLGAVSRMISLYAHREPLQNGRIPHTIRGCQILDILISTVLDRTTSNTLDECTDIALDEDGLDEWEVWESLNGPASKGGRRSTPLRALSIFDFNYSMLQRLQTTCTEIPVNWNVDEVLGSLHISATELPSYCQISPTTPLTPCVMAMQLFRGFAVTTVLNAADKASVESTMVQEIARSTLTVLRTYNNIGASLPLSLHFVVRHCHNMLEAFEPITGDNGLLNLLRKPESDRYIVPTSQNQSRPRGRRWQAHFADRRPVLSLTSSMATQRCPLRAPHAPTQRTPNTIDETQHSLDFDRLFASVIPGSLQDDSIELSSTEFRTFGISSFGDTLQEEADFITDTEFNKLLEEFPLDTGSIA